MTGSVSLWQLFVAFLRPNLLGYGGGPGVIPLLQAEVVDTFQWMTNAQFGEALALGNTLPGPIATKMAAYLGYKLAGVLGSAIALAATILPTALIMILLAGFLLRYSGSPVIKGMIKGVKPVIFIMFVLLALDFAPAANPLSAGWIPLAIAVVAFVGIYFFNVHQALAVLAALVIGAVVLR